MLERDSAYIRLRKASTNYSSFRTKFLRLGNRLKQQEWAKHLDTLGVTGFEVSEDRPRVDFRYLDQHYGFRLVAPPITDPMPVQFFRVTRQAPEELEVLQIVAMDGQGNLRGDGEALSVDEEFGPIFQLMKWLSVANGKPAPQK